MSNEMHYSTSLGETLIKPYEMRCNVDCRSICKCRCDLCIVKEHPKMEI